MDKTLFVLPTPKILAPEDCQEFRQYFKDNLKIAEYDEIDRCALKMFESYSSSFIHPRAYKSRDFHQLFIIESGSDIVFVAHQTKIYNPDSAERLVYLVEMSKSRYIGHGEIRFNPNSEEPFFKDKPFVGFTNTEEAFRRRGIGTRRLEIMNGLTNILFNLPLHSSQFKEDYKKDSESPWKMQVRLGNARRYFFEGGHRYCFKGIV